MRSGTCPDHRRRSRSRCSPRPPALRCSRQRPCCTPRPRESLSGRSCSRSPEQGKLFGLWLYTVALGDQHRDVWRAPIAAGRGRHGGKELEARSGSIAAAPTVVMGLLNSAATAAAPRRGSRARGRCAPRTVPWQGTAGRSRRSGSWCQRRCDRQPHASRLNLFQLEQCGCECVPRLVVSRGSGGGCSCGRGRGVV